MWSSHSFLSLDVFENRITTPGGDVAAVLAVSGQAAVDSCPFYAIAAVSNKSILHTSSVFLSVWAQIALVRRNGGEGQYSPRSVFNE